MRTGWVLVESQLRTVVGGVKTETGEPCDRGRSSVSLEKILCLNQNSEGTNFGKTLQRNHV